MTRRDPRTAKQYRVALEKKILADQAEKVQICSQDKFI
jgi:hypothetical protein